LNKVDFKGSVVLNPVPVVLITSRNKSGKDNVFTVGWTGTICTKPPMLSISIRPERLSYEYICETMEFIVNMPSSEMVKAVDYCGVKPGRKFDKIKDMGFTMKEGTNVNVAYIDECPVTIECKVKDIIKLGTHDMFIAEVVGSHINSNLIDEKGKIHFEKGDLISYCHGEYFKLPQNSIGSFGFSVSKKIKDSKKQKDSKINNNKKIEEKSKNNFLNKNNSPNNSSKSNSKKNHINKSKKASNSIKFKKKNK